MDSDWRNSDGERMPRDVGSFSRLHDYVDANMYLIDLVPDPRPACDCDMSRLVPSYYHPGTMVPDHTDACAVNSEAYEQASEEYTDVLNAVSNLVDRWLAEEALALNTGERCRCGRLTRFNGGHGRGHYVHLDDGSHQCDPCEFCLRCPVCFQELESSGPFDGTEPSTGVTDGHEGFGETFICTNLQASPVHQFTWLNREMVPMERIMTVVNGPDQSHPDGAYLTSDQVEVILSALKRDVSTSVTWADIRDMSVSDMCAANQDALIDDLYERNPDDSAHRGEMVRYVLVYDHLLGTNRASEIPGE
jgi:hypothetical protein